MEIDNNGYLVNCRWASNKSTSQKYHISEVDPESFWQNNMSALRQDLLAGKSQDMCSYCYKMEQHGKISGRQRQLLKTGVTVKDFERSLKSSPYFSEFEYSYNNQGNTQEFPVDWQIEIGNFCNNACLMCNEYFSTRLGKDLKRIGAIEHEVYNNWADNPALVDKLIGFLTKIPKLRYIHIIGGEPMIIPAFKKILTKVVESGLASSCSIGITTNLTVFDQNIVDLLAEFNHASIGLSIECLHPINEYIRYGSSYSKTVENLNKWVEAKNLYSNWTVELRTTPTALSILHLDTIYEYALLNGCSVESCDFLHKPEFLRPTVLPKKYRNIVIEKLERFLEQNNLVVKENADLIINTRNPGTIESYISQDIASYLHYLKTSDFETYRLPDLNQYITKMEAIRKNNLMDYLPEYEDILQCR